MSDRPGTMLRMSEPATKTKRKKARQGVLRSATGVKLTRDVTFRFALDPTRAQAHQFYSYAGAARYTFNHHLARIKANLDQRTAERTYGIADHGLTPSLSWSAFTFINEFNAYKNGTLPSSPANDDGTAGLSWRNEVSADVFESASGNAATALKNFTESRGGTRAGKPAGFPKFKSRHKTTPSFRLRNRAKVGASQAIRVTGPKALRLPTIGDVRVHGCTKKMRRMLEAGRLHLYSATVKFEKGRWFVTLTGKAAVFHHARRSHVGRHQDPAGIDRGIKALAVVGDSTGRVLHTVKAVKALQRDEQKLRRANKTFARTKLGSVGRSKAKQRLTKIHAHIGNVRLHAAHELTAWLAQALTRLTVEDLNIAGMLGLRSLAKALSDAGMGQVGRQIEYKAGWYNLDLAVADRWFASTKACSGCRNVKDEMGLDERTYRCEKCGLVLDRDVNAAINLATWPEHAHDWYTARTKKPGAPAPPIAA